MILIILEMNNWKIKTLICNDHRMGNADVMRMETSHQQHNHLQHGHQQHNHHHQRHQQQQHTMQQSYDLVDQIVRRSNSEPKLNDAEMEQPERGNGSKSMVNFPSQHQQSSDLMATAWRRNSESNPINSHRNWQPFHHKYVQSPILEETDSALERELHTGSARHGYSTSFLTIKISI